MACGGCAKRREKIGRAVRAVTDAVAERVHAKGIAALRKLIQEHPEKRKFLPAHLLKQIEE